MTLPLFGISVTEKPGEDGAVHHQEYTQTQQEGYDGGPDPDGDSDNSPGMERNGAEKHKYH